MEAWMGFDDNIQFAFSCVFIGMQEKRETNKASKSAILYGGAMKLKCLPALYLYPSFNVLL